MYSIGDSGPFRFSLEDSVYQLPYGRRQASLKEKIQQVFAQSYKSEAEAVDALKDLQTHIVQELRANNKNELAVIVELTIARLADTMLPGTHLGTKRPLEEEVELPHRKKARVEEVSGEEQPSDVTSLEEKVQPHIQPIRPGKRRRVKEQEEAPPAKRTRLEPPVPQELSEQELLPPELAASLRSRFNEVVRYLNSPSFNMQALFFDTFESLERESSRDVNVHVSKKMEKTFGFSVPDLQTAFYSQMIEGFLSKEQNSLTTEEKNILLTLKSQLIAALPQTLFESFLLALPEEVEDYPKNISPDDVADLTHGLAEKIVHQVKNLQDGDFLTLPFGFATDRGGMHAIVIEVQKRGDKYSVVIFNTATLLHAAEKREEEISGRVFPLECANLSEEDIENLLFEAVSIPDEGGFNTEDQFYYTLFKYSQTINKKPVGYVSYREQELDNCPQKSILVWLHSHLRNVNNGETYWKLRTYITDYLVGKAGEMLEKPSSTIPIPYQHPCEGMPPFKENIKDALPEIPEKHLRSLYDQGSAELKKRKSKLTISSNLEEYSR
jgi:hypothetical protein